MKQIVVKRVCYSCGNDHTDTAEHVIARTLVPEPRPHNLVTVPACRPCNEAISQDEEYLRDRLSAVVTGPDFEAPPTWAVAWRSMQRVQSKGKKSAFLKDVIKLSSAVRTKNGLSNIGVGLEKRRVNIVIAKMVRGFYFHMFGKPLGDVEVQIDMLSSINSARIEPLFCRLSTNYKSPTWAENFGPHTHAICSLAEGENRAGLWCFKLFGQHLAVALVAPESYFTGQTANPSHREFAFTATAIFRDGNYLLDRDLTLPMSS